MLLSCTDSGEHYIIGLSRNFPLADNYKIRLFDEPLERQDSNRKGWISPVPLIASPTKPYSPSSLSGCLQQVIAVYCTAKCSIYSKDRVQAVGGVAVQYSATEQLEGMLILRHPRTLQKHSDWNAVCGTQLSGG